MSGFVSLLELSGKKVVQQGKSKGSKLRLRGCENCPTNKKKGIQKIFGEVAGKDLMVWAQSPGGKENRLGKELVGNAGKWFWSEMKKVGLSRKDCDIQNVVRCFPADRNDEGELEMRDPSKAELHCCSLYNDRAIEKSKAKVHLVLGKVAAAQVLGKELKKNIRVFWSERLQAKVIYVDHPSYFLRGAPRARLAAFRLGLKSVVQALNCPPGKFGYLTQYEYKPVFTVEQAEKAERIIRKYAAKGRRISFDLEDPIIKGKHVLYAVGFCYKPGHSRIFVIDHPKNKQPEKVREKLKEIAGRLLSDPFVKKVAQHGSHDEFGVRKLLGVKLLGYEYDTQYAEYFREPGHRSYALEALISRRLPEFASYKDLLLPEIVPEEILKKHIADDVVDPVLRWKKFNAAYTEARKTGNLAWDKVPLDRFITYNGVDCDVTKRLEVQTKDIVPLPLLRVYMDDAFVIDKMEKNGPLFDYEHYQVLEKIFPPRRDRKLGELQMMVGNPEFNPNASKQVISALYDKFKFPLVAQDKKTKKFIRSGDKPTLKRLIEEVDHPFPQAMMDYRRDNKICTTYLKGFKDCADWNGGWLRTIWHLTGTGTGRLRSGGKDTGDEGIVNLQNIHGDPQLQNLLISDRRWRKVQTAWDEPFADWKAESEKYYKYLYASLWPRFSGKGDKAKTIWKKACEEKQKEAKAELFSWLEKNQDEDWWYEFRHYTTYLTFDYSQIEIRMLAQMSGDQLLIDIIKSGEDLHSSVGSEITGWPIEQIINDKATRTCAKQIHFGIVYGLQVSGLYKKLRAEGIDITEARVQELHNAYFKKFTGVARFIDQMQEMVEDKGYVETMFGFRRPLDAGGRQDDDEGGGAYWGNQAVNTPIQGGAHQLVLMAMANLKRKRVTYQLLQDLRMEVHDALVLHVQLMNLAKAHADASQLLEKDVVKIVRKEFKIDWDVPLAAEAEGGLRFGTMVDVNKDQDVGLYLNEWCMKNHEKQLLLQDELNKIAA